MLLFIPSHNIHLVLIFASNRIISNIGNLVFLKPKVSVTAEAASKSFMSLEISRPPLLLKR